MFNFIKNQLKKIYSTITQKAHALFGSSVVDEQLLQELETILITADTGVQTTRELIAALRAQVQAGAVSNGAQLKKALHEQLLLLLQSTKALPTNPHVYILVGINGSGKTTTAGKLAALMTKQGDKVLFAAADTFRAAAPEQLAYWASVAQSGIVTGKEGQDPASVVFQACQQYKEQQASMLIVDTAGRLQTKTNLMLELEKIQRIIKKQLPEVTIATLLTVDSMLGQNSLEQARRFHDTVALDGVILTKMDGTAKGGIVFAIARELRIPVAFISYGEGVEHIRSFEPKAFVDELLG